MKELRDFNWVGLIPDQEREPWVSSTYHSNNIDELRTLVKQQFQEITKNAIELRRQAAIGRRCNITIQKQTVCNEKTVQDKLYTIRTNIKAYADDTGCA